jgi:hypothetical protein
VGGEGGMTVKHSDSRAILSTSRTTDYQCLMDVARFMRKSAHSERSRRIATSREGEGHDEQGVSK